MSEAVTTRLVNIQGEPLAVRLYEPVVDGIVTEYLGDAVLIHGYTGSKEDFEPMAGLLAQAGFRVLIWDNRGQHESPHSDREDAYSIASLARDAAALAADAGLKRPHLLGHSFGGLVAQRAVADDPIRWTSLTLMCSGPCGVADYGRDFKAVIEHLSTRTMAQEWEAERDATERAHPRYELRKRRWLVSDPRSVSTQARALIEQPSIVPQVLASGVPVHVVYGDLDDGWPLAMQDQMARDLNAPVTVISGAGHNPAAEAPEATAAVLADYWENV